MKFPYLSPNDPNHKGQLMPFMPISLKYKNLSVNTTALLDTGAAVNLLPYDIGLSLGIVWDEQTMPLQLTGSLGKFEARAVFVHTFIQGYIPYKDNLHKSEQPSPAREGCSDLKILKGHLK